MAAIWQAREILLTRYLSGRLTPDDPPRSEAAKLLLRQVGQLSPRMLLGEALRFSAQALRANPVRSLLTGLGMVIGTASVILVVTISLTSRDYILEQVEGIGSNIIFAYYVNRRADHRRPPTPTTSKWPTSRPSARSWPAISSPPPASCRTSTRMLIGGKVHDVKVIGTDEYYASGAQHRHQLRTRFWTRATCRCARKVALLTDHAGGTHVRQHTPRP